MSERVIRRLGELGLVPPAEDTGALETYLTAAKRELLAETGQTRLVKELKEVAVDMAAGAYLSWRKSVGRLEDFDEERLIRQMSQGDTSITYAVAFGQASPLEALIEKLATPPEALLRKWRRFRW